MDSRTPVQAVRKLRTTWTVSERKMTHRQSLHTESSYFGTQFMSPLKRLQNDVEPQQHTANACLSLVSQKTRVLESYRPLDFDKVFRRHERPSGVVTGTSRRSEIGA